MSVAFFPAAVAVEAPMPGFGFVSRVLRFEETGLEFKTPLHGPSMDRFMDCESETFE
jgi:hypothetical protein